MLAIKVVALLSCSFDFVASPDPEEGDDGQQYHSSNDEKECHPYTSF